MGTRFARRNAEGKVEYHDSHAAMLAAERQEALETQRGVFGLAGLVIGGVLMVALANRLGADDWPKWLRMVMVVSGTCGTSLLLAVLAEVLWPLLVLCFQTVLMYVIGRLLWTFI